MTDVRQPAVAGQFYRGSRSALTEQIEACFRDEHGPGTVPNQPEPDADPEPNRDADPASVLGLVVPHAGYPYSGPIAAHAYDHLARAGGTDTAVILGPNHRGTGAEIALSPHDAWETPLGTIPIDDRLGEAIRGRVEAARIDGHAHAAEHSLEVQVPFLQYLEAASRIVPITLATRDPGTVGSVGKAIAAAIEATEQDAVVIASTDLTHYEPPEAARIADEPVLDLIGDREPDGLLDHVQRTAHTMCGPGATAAMLEATERLGAHSAAVYTYATSAETADTGGRTVGYTAVGVGED